MPAYRSGIPGSDVPDLITEEPPPTRGKRGKRGKPAAPEASFYYPHSDPSEAMVKGVIPPGGHAAGGQAGLATAVSN